MEQENENKDTMLYKQNHQLPEKMIYNVLVRMGCKEIKNIDYPLNDANIPKEGLRIGTLIPDFRCIYKDKICVVEIGKINESSNGVGKIQRLLAEYPYVIHIYSDDEFYVLHCILYERRQLTDEKLIKSLFDQLDNINSLLEEFDVKKLYDYPRNPKSY